eukprot:17058-Eustigmatos_ZCMA.PRE.1
MLLRTGLYYAVVGAWVDSADAVTARRCDAYWALLRSSRGTYGLSAFRGLQKAAPRPPPDVEVLRKQHIASSCLDRD